MSQLLKSPTSATVLAMPTAAFGKLNVILVLVSVLVTVVLEAVTAFSVVLVVAFLVVAAVAMVASTVGVAAFLVAIFFKNSC